MQTNTEQLSEGTPKGNPICRPTAVLPTPCLAHRNSLRLPEHLSPHAAVTAGLLILVGGETQQEEGNWRARFMFNDAFSIEIVRRRMV
jgi:hypothetical protein